MATYQFTIIATGLDPEAPDFEERFFDAGCADATIALQKGVIVIEFEREARNFAHALLSAIGDVQRAGAKVERVEPDELVSISDIAQRSGLTRAAISLFANGERGTDFPRPVARITTDSPLWDWVEVARWLSSRGHLARSAVVEARVTRAASRSVTRSDERDRQRIALEILAEAKKHSLDDTAIRQLLAEGRRG